MQEKLFEAALGIVDPWRVSGIDFGGVGKTLSISVGFVAGSRFIAAGSERTSGT
jgi:hypothetical protein